MPVWAHNEYLGSQEDKRMVTSYKNFNFVKRNKTLGTEINSFCCTNI